MSYAANPYGGPPVAEGEAPVKAHVVAFGFVIEKSLREGDKLDAYWYCTCGKRFVHGYKGQEHIDEAAKRSLE